MDEEKRRRLEAWRRKQEQKKEQQKVKVDISHIVPPKKKKAAPKKVTPNPFGDSSDDDEANEPTKRKRPLDFFDDSTLGSAQTSSDDPVKPSVKKRRRGRWDKEKETNKSESNQKDALDSFMEKLSAGASGHVTASAGADNSTLLINVSGTMLSKPTPQPAKSPLAGGTITADQLMKQKYHPKDWLSDAPSDTDDEHDEEARRALVEALKKAPAPQAVAPPPEVENDHVHHLASEVKSEKSRRHQHLKSLELQAEQARVRASAAPEFGRLYNDSETMMEEAERRLQAAKEAPDALQVLAELNKKKELKAVDHSTIDYIEFEKNLYRVPRSLASLTNDQVINQRAKLKVRVRGHGAPAPVSTFEECGLSNQLLELLADQNIHKPFPIQAQCVPCIMAGRDVIGIAKTGSGKTLAYLLPLFRHIGVQPQLAPNESGPIGLVLAPARELAFQIHTVCKQFAKHLGYK